MEAVGLFEEVVEAIQILIGGQGIGRDPGAQLLSIGGDVIDNLPAGDLLQIRKPVAVGVLTVGARAQPDLACIVQPVAIAIGLQQRCTGLVFVEIGQPVAVGIARAVVRIGTPVALIDQPIAVGIALAGQRLRAILRPGQRIPAILLHEIVELFEVGRKDVQNNLLTEIDMRGAGIGSHGADGNQRIERDTRRQHGRVRNGPALLHRQSVALGKIEADGPIDPRLLQGHTGNINRSSNPEGDDLILTVVRLRRRPFVFHVATRERLVDVGLFCLQSVGKRGIIQLIVIEHPGVGQRFPIDRNEAFAALPTIEHLLPRGKDVSQLNGVGEREAELQRVARRHAPARCSQILIEAKDLQTRRIFSFAHVDQIMSVIKPVLDGAGRQTAQSLAEPLSNRMGLRFIANGGANSDNDSIDHADNRRDHRAHGIHRQDKHQGQHVDLRHGLRQ